MVYVEAQSSRPDQDSWSAPHLWPVVLGITPPPTLQSCTLSPANSNVADGSSKQFTVTGHYSDGSTQNLTAQATYSSSNTFVATINGAGVAHALALGTTTITTSLAGGAISCTATMTVVNPPPPPTLLSCAVTPANPVLDLGTNQTFVATGHYSDGSTQNLTAQATWSSSVTAVATVNAQAFARTVGLGSTTITASGIPGGISCSTTLTVIVRPTLQSITVAPGNPTIIAGQTKTFTATGHYSDGSTLNITASVTWTSSTPAVATVHGGVATSIAAGSTIITATLSGVSGSTTLTVVPRVVIPPPPCPGGDVSYLMEFNFAGGAFNTPVFNYNGASTSVSNLLAANGVLLGNVYASSAVYSNFTGANNGDGGSIGFITLGNGNIDSIYQIGMGRQRFAWSEVR